MCRALPRAVLGDMKPLGTQLGPGFPLQQLRRQRRALIPLMACALLWDCWEGDVGQLPFLCPIPGWAEDLGSSLEHSHGRGGAVMPWNLQTHSFPQEKEGWGHTLLWYQRAEHGQQHGAGTGLPWLLWGFSEPHSLVFSASSGAAGSPPALPHRTAHLLHPRISFCPRWLCLCALTRGWAAPNPALPLAGTAGVNDSRRGEATHRSCDPAKTCGSG